MKTRLTIVLLFLVNSWLTAQNQDKNYVSTSTAKVPLKGTLKGINNKDSVQQTIQYADGLGRPVQMVVRQATPDGKDLVTPTVYDPYGREVKKYLPFKSANSNGSFVPDPLNSQKSFYDQHFNDNSGDHAFSETLFENSPLGRPKRQAAPGSAWQMNNDHTVDMSYRNNEAADQVRLIKMSNKVIVASQNYPVAELSVTITSDENTGIAKGQTIVFTDKLGRTVLKRSKLDSTNYLSTYFVYDEYGNQRMVIPPAAVAEITNSNNWSLLQDEDFQKKWLFCYQYDGRNRLITQKVPGADSVHMIYDQRDRLVMTQDGNQRADNIEQVNDTLRVDGFYGKNYQINGTGQFETTGYVEFSGHFQAGADVPATPKRWIFTKYDALDRPVITGFYYSEESPEALQTQVDSANNLITNFTGTGPLKGYEDTAFPLDISEDELLTVSYYDNYGFTDIQSIKPDYAFLQLKGQVTGSLTRILGCNRWLQTINFYDNRYRSIKMVADNHKNGKDVIITDYKNEVSPLVSQTISKHSSDNHNGTITIIEKFTYDHMDRLLSQTHQVNNGPEITLTDNTYNDLGELISKKVGNNAQQVDYAYNIRGWLTSINGGATLSGGNQFGMQLDYESAGQYNGNIGKMSWHSLGGPGTNMQSYTYTYDPLNRLKSATYFSSGKNGHFDVEHLNYDHNGNIMSLLRRQNGTILDSLVYDYAGNRLIAVEDSGNKQEGFIDGNTNPVSDEYQYDENGNMIIDDNKKITFISYNFMNLVERVDFDNGDQIRYTYDAAGIKLSKTAEIGESVTTTDYINGMHYINGQLSFIQSSEGRILNNNGAFDYEYHLTDHLGNVRVTVDEGGNAVQKDDYYPFGLSFNSWNDTSPTNDYLYNEGAELQRELTSYQTHFRMLDPALGRWWQIDPKASERESPYVSMANNPILYNDALGDTIDFSQLMVHDKVNGTNVAQTIVNSLSKITGLRLSIDQKTGILDYAKDENGKAIVSSDYEESICSCLATGSETARGDLIDAIDGDLVKVDYSSKTTITDGANNQIWFSSNQVDGFIKGTPAELNKETQGYGMTMLHELRHTSIGGRLSDPQDKTDTESTGPVVDRVNIYRRELGRSYGQRGHYYATGTGSDKYVRFSYSDYSKGKFKQRSTRIKVK